MKQTFHVILTIITGLLTGYFFITGFTPVGMLFGVLTSNTNNEIAILISMLISMLKSIILCLIFFIITKILYKSLMKNEKGQ